MKIKLINITSIIALTSFIGGSFISCVKNPNEPVTISSIISLVINDNGNTNEKIGIPADGVSKINIKAILGEESDDQKSISFYASNGQLMSYDGSAYTTTLNQIAVNKEASVLLKSSTKVESDVYITAKVDNYLIKRYLEFLPSYPDTFFVEPEDYITKSTKINISVALMKNIGFVSSKIPVYFETSSVDTNGVNVSIDPYQITSENTSNIPTSVKVILQKTNEKKGKILLKVFCTNSKGIVVEKSVSLQFE
jgi:hypothetical protein